MNKCIFLLVFSIATAAQPTPQTADWSGVTYYQTSSAPSVNKPKPPIPEPSVYGAIFMAASLSLLGWRKLKNR